MRTEQFENTIGQNTTRSSFLHEGGYSVSESTLRGWEIGVGILFVVMMLGPLAAGMLPVA